MSNEGEEQETHWSVPEEIDPSKLFSLAHSTSCLWTEAEKVRNFFLISGLDRHWRWKSCGHGVSDRKTERQRVKRHTLGCRVCRERWGRYNLSVTEIVRRSASTALVSSFMA